MKAHPNITKLFAKAEPIGKNDERFEGYITHFDVDSSNIRQLFIFDVYAVETSCGMAVPYMDYKKERKALKKWAKNMAEEGRLDGYMKDHEEPVDLHGLGD